MRVEKEKAEARRVTVLLEETEAGRCAAEMVLCSVYSDNHGYPSIATFPPPRPCMRGLST